MQQNHEEEKKEEEVKAKEEKKMVVEIKREEDDEDLDFVPISMPSFWVNGNDYELLLNNYKSLIIN